MTILILLSAKGFSSARKQVGHVSQSCIEMEAHEALPLPIKLLSTGGL